MNVKNMHSGNGNKVPNQFILTADDGTRVFQSYETTIARINGITGGITLDADAWAYSRTTAKYRNLFLGLTTAETKRKIKSGEIALANLNQ